MGMSRYIFFSLKLFYLDTVRVHSCALTLGYLKNTFHSALAQFNDKFWKCRSAALGSFRGGCYHEATKAINFYCLQRTTVAGTVPDKTNFVMRTMLIGLVGGIETTGIEASATAFFWINWQTVSVSSTELYMTKWLTSLFLVIFNVTTFWVTYKSIRRRQTLDRMIPPLL